jgi:hypothetical protein
MNIFALDNNPIQAAQWLCDKHVVKMILESAQLLSTAHRVLDDVPAGSPLYKKTHENHPCAIWVRESFANYVWLYYHLRALLQEYTYRYGKHHKVEELMDVLIIPPDNIHHSLDQTEFAQAMPEQYKIPGNPIQAYRNYYKHEKLRIARYTNRDFPEWML